MHIKLVNWLDSSKDLPMIPVSAQFASHLSAWESQWVQDRPLGDVFTLQGIKLTTARSALQHVIVNLIHK